MNASAFMPSKMKWRGIKTLGLTEPTKKVTDPDDDESGEIFLKELAESLDDNEATGENVKTHLADIINKRSGKKLSPEKIKTS